MKNIHLSFATFHSQMNKLAEFSTYLSNDEIQRAEEFAFRHLRDQFIISRGFLRKVLSEHIKINPNKINFIYSEYGKPSIKLPKKTKLHFNLSHSQDYFAIGISDFCPIGLDIEYCNPSMDIEGVASEVFSPFEISRLFSLPKEKTRKEFFRMWTIKEAYIKAIGKGFSFDPKWIEINEDTNTFHFTDNYKKTCCASQTKNTTDELAKDWYFLEYDFDPNYNLSLVTSCAKSNIICTQ